MRLEGVLSEGIGAHNKETDMANSVYTVRTYRVDNGEHIAHLDRDFDSVDAAKAHALAANCKAFTPFISIVKGADQ